MEKIDLTGWKELDNTEVGTYLNDKKDSINTSSYDDAIDTKYSYETQIEKKARPDYFGKTEITGELKTIMRNPASSFGRGAWNNVLGLGKGVAEDVVRKGETIAEIASYEMLPAGAERYKFNQKLEEGANNLSKKVQDWFAQYETTIDERDRVLPTEIGSVTGSLFSSVGLTMLTKSPTLVAEVFGSSASGEYAEELRNKGVNVFEAQAVASGLGAFQGITEQYGADKIVDAFGKKIVVDKLVKNKIAKYIGKTGAIEGLEEVVQQGAEETVMNALDYRDTPVWESVKNVLEAGALGFVGGAIGGGVSLPFMIKTKENTKQSLIEKGVDEEKATTLAEDASFGNTQAINEIKDIYKEDLKKQLKDKGKTEEEINEFVDGLDFDNEETQNEIADFINKEAGLDTLVGDTYEADVKRFNDEANLDVRLQAFDIKDQVKEQVMKVQGVSEQDAESLGVLASDFTKAMYEVTGVTPAEQWQDKGLNIVDERMANEVETQDIVNNGTELTEDDLARLGVTEEELDRLAEESPMDELYYQPAKEEYRQETRDIADTQQRIKEWEDVRERDKANERGLNPDVVENNIKLADKRIKELKKELKELQESLKEPLGEKLYATHNMSLAGVKGALRLGGLAMPSLALRKVSQGNINQFGDIVFVANKNLVEPSRSVDVFDRDAWTPSIAQQIRYNITEDGRNFIKDVLKRNDQEREASMYIYNIVENIDSPKSNDMAIDLYCLDKGIEKQTSNNIAYTQDYLDWYEENIAGNSEPYLWTENASNTDMVAEKFTLENIMKILKKQERSGGGFIGNTVFNVNEILQFMAQKFKSLKDVKQAKGRIVSREEQSNYINELNDEFYKLAEELKREDKEYEYGEDRKDLAIALANGKRNIREAMKRWNLNVTDENVNKVEQFYDKLENVLTDYFEVKPRRVVDFDEFSGVIIPDGKEYDEVARLLKYKGLDVHRVEKGNTEEYSDALNNIYKEKKDVFFQDKGASRGAFTPSQNLIELFKTADSSTLVHELGHFFTINYIKACKEYGQEDRLTGIYQWLGVKDESEMNTDHWERLARAFETYAMEGQAPNMATQTLFQKMKKWLLDVYEDITGTILKPEEINDDVREFFDRMFASEKVDISGIEDLFTKMEDVKQVITAMQEGKDISVGGVTKQGIVQLERAAHARLPKKPHSLLDDLLEIGITEKFADEFDIKELMGVADIADKSKQKELKKSKIITQKDINRLNKLFVKENGIEREDELIEFLVEKRYLEDLPQNTASEVEEVQRRAFNLLSKADRVYNNEAQEIENTRNTLIEAQEFVKKLNLEEIEKAIKTLKSEDIVAVDKNSLKYLKEKIKGITKDYNKIVKSLTKYRDTQESKDSIRKQLADYIKNQSLSAEHKVSLTNRLNKADTLPALNKVANAVYKQATRFYESEQKKIFVRNIERELKKTKPTSAGQRYNYETNKLFVDIRKYDKMTKAEAESALNTFEESDDAEENILRKDFLSYKAHGMESSVDMLEEVLNGIQKAKYLGEQAKDEKDFADRLNNEQARQDILEAISRNKADKSKLSTQITNLYRRGFANLYSLINSISSKELAEKYQFETLINDADKKIYKHTDNMIKTVMDVLGLKKKSDFLNIAAEMGQKVTTLYNQAEGLNQKKYDLSRWDIIDIYLGMKNENTKEQFIKTYGEEQLDNVLGLLSPSDIQIAEIMFNDIQPLYEDVNKVYIRQKGMDLLKVENYWPRSSEHKEDVDVFNDFKMQSTSPSFTKERAVNVEPLPKNAWSKYLRHINESYYLTTVAEKQAEMNKIWSSSRVENAIVNKYGQPVYDQLKKSIDAISLHGREDDISFVDGILGKGFNNFVVAKIALAPTVFAGQLTSVTNYAENINTGDFYKYFAEGLKHPKQTVAFMKQVAGAFLDTRYHGGFNESVSNVLRETENASKKRFRLFSVGGEYDYTNALTSWVRTGDIGAIIFGGYAQIRANLESGKSLKESVDQFEFDTLRSQQSGNAASLSGMQRSKGLARIVLAFKNTQHQYLRKMVDAAIQYQRGEISLDQAAKIYMNYAVLQPALYVLAKNLVKSALGLTDDDDSMSDGLIEQLLLSWTDAIPLFTDIMHYAYRKATDQYTGNLVNVLGADDINKSAKKLAKENKSLYDWAELISPLVEATTSLPTSRAISMTKKYMEE